MWFLYKIKKNQINFLLRIKTQSSIKNGHKLFI